jgi:hypothetical protein
MLFPKYVLDDLSVGSGLIIGKDNIEEFFNHISMHKEVEEKSLVELAPSIEVASAYLIHMLEARFASLRACLFGLWLAGCVGKAAVQGKLLCRESCCSEFNCLAIWLAG